MTKVIFDSSFLMAVGDNPTQWMEGISDSVGGFEPVMLDCVFNELTALASLGGAKAARARTALELAKGFLRSGNGGAETDKEIVSAALTMGAAVATADEDLISTLLARRVKVFGLSSGRVRVR